MVASDEGAAGTSTGSRRPARELSALIQPFPDAISEERLTRSKSKALVFFLNIYVNNHENFLFRPPYILKHIFGIW